MRITIFFCLTVLLAFTSNAQNMGDKNEKDKPVFSEDKFEYNYQKRIKKEVIYGVYIPKDLADCFIQLNKLVDDNSLAKFKAMPEEEAVSKLHFSFGRWMIHNWGFYEGSRLSHYLKETLQVSYPDDMAAFIIITYHRNLNKSELKVRELADRFIKKRKKQFEEKKNRGEVLFQEKKIRPKNQPERRD